MSQKAANSLAIQLADGRTIIATPGPEDQDRLAQFGNGPIILSAAEADTSGHAYSSEVSLDVEGHAVTLRLPTPADADALRKALAVGVVTATLVAAGAIAAMQQTPSTPAAPAAQNIISRPAAPAPAEDFQTRREREIDRLLEAPAGGPPAVDAPTNQRIGGPRE